MKSIRVTTAGNDFVYVIYVQHIISVSTSNENNKTFIRVVNGDSILVKGSLAEIQNQIES